MSTFLQNVVEIIHNISIYSDKCIQQYSNNNYKYVNDFDKITFTITIIVINTIISKETIISL